MNDHEKKKLARIIRIEKEAAALRTEIEADSSRSLKAAGIVVVGESVEYHGDIYRVVAPGIDEDCDVLVAPKSGGYARHQRLVELKNMNGDQVTAVVPFRIGNNDRRFWCDGVGMTKSGSNWNHGAIKARCSLAASTLWPNYDGPAYVEDEA